MRKGTATIPEGYATYKREIVGFPWARLNQELIPPGIQGFKRLGVIHVVHENTAVGTAIEGDSQ